VELLEGRLLPTAYVVTTAKDILGDTAPGEVTLRDALTALDGTPSGNATAVGTDTNSISFAIPGSGPQEIDVGSDLSALNQGLPAITRQVFLDGWSQGGPGYQGPPLIVLQNAIGGTDSASGLTLQPGSDGSTVRGFVIEQFGRDGITLDGTGGNLIAGNYIGTDASGASPLPDIAAGVSIRGGATANTVGGTTTGAANVLTGDNYYQRGAIEITGSGTSGNVILGNFIGTDASGTVSLGNGYYGVLIGGGATANTIGGTGAGAANLISANAYGVKLVGSGTSGNVVLGNLIGTDAGGAAPFGNVFGGVLIAGGATANTVGGTVSGAANVISGNPTDVLIDDPGTSGNVVLGNLIGTDKSGTVALRVGEGLFIGNGATANTVGGTTAGAGNVISGNGSAVLPFFNGVDISGIGTSGNLVQGNFIGTDKSGTIALGNGSDGVIIRDGATANTVGGSAAGAGNIISGNGANGIEISGRGTSGNLLAGNYIGTDVTGTAALGNAIDGVHLVGGATGNTIGGTADGARNVISGNRFQGVYLSEGGTSRNVVAGNYVGTDQGGTVALGNGAAGVYVNGAADNTIGGAAPGAGNVISAAAFDGVFITGSGAGGNLVAGNLIGTDAGGKAGLGNADSGVYILNAGGNTVGGATAGARNVISSNGAAGVYISGSGAEGNWIAGNYIGTDVTGTAALGNSQDGVVIASQATANIVGGPLAANVISANHLNGLSIVDSGTAQNAVRGNLIGTDFTGTAALGNAFSGVLISSRATANTVGGTIAPNVISANGDGVVIANNGTSGNIVLGNRIGTDINGTAALGNRGDGVQINGAMGNTVGGTIPGAANLISANTNGVEITDLSASGNVVLGNLVGTDISGTQKLGNGRGVFIRGGATANTVGGTTAGAANLVSGNNEGVSIEDRGTNRNLVQGNLIGTDRSGAAPLGNGVAGVLIFRGAGNTVGGTAAGAGNVISGSSFNGLVITDGASGNVVLGNFIGTDQSGMAPLGNGSDGVLISQAPGNVVGGTTPGAANVISANGGEGVEITGASGNVLLGNLIGTDITGTAPLGNAFLGIWLDNGATANTVGGTAPGAGNVISANGTYGIQIGQSSRNAVLGNFIGTDKTGKAPLGNAQYGVLIFDGATANTVGGTAAGAGNVISANQVGVFFFGDGTSRNVALGNLIGTDRPGAPLLIENNFGVAIGGGATGNTVGGTARGAGNVISGNVYGVDIFQPGTSGNVVLGNLIGTDKRGTAGPGNTGIGVILEGGASYNTLGGTLPGSGNVIAFNGKGIILIDGTTTGNSLLGNRIFANHGPGIDVNDDGPTPNGRNPRALPNGGQNTPVITALTLHSISGALRSVPRTPFRIEFFATPAGGRADQGQTFLGFLNVATNGAGAVAFTAPLAVPPGTIVTATATNLSTGDTSEFSPAGTQLLVTSEPAIVFSAGWQAVTLTAQVFFAGAPVAGGVVVFRVAGVPGAVAGRVNANGVATVTFLVPPLTAPGRYVVTATFLRAGAIPPAVGDSFLTIVPPYQWLGRRGL
jgi:hypothetical protein